MDATGLEKNPGDPQDDCGSPTRSRAGLADARGCGAGGDEAIG